MNNYYGMTFPKIFLVTSTDSEERTTVLLTTLRQELAEELRDNLDDADTAGAYGYAVTEMLIAG